MISEKMRRFGEICIQCPIFANNICFLIGVGSLRNTDKFSDASVSHSMSLQTPKWQFTIFLDLFDFLNFFMR